MDGVVRLIGAVKCSRDNDGVLSDDEFRNKKDTGTEYRHTITERTSLEGTWNSECHDHFLTLFFLSTAKPSWIVLIEQDAE